VVWVTDLGATQTREKLYHKTMEMAWITKMMIGKVISKTYEKSKKSKTYEKYEKSKKTYEKYEKSKK
jgi:hypothetical protein